MDETVLVIEIAKEDNKLKMSAFEKHKSTDHRHYSEITISSSEIESLCGDVGELLKKANRSGKLQDELLVELKKNGHLLFDSLFTIEIKNTLKTTTSKYLILSIDEKLVQIPWELLFDGENFLCLRFALGRSVRTRQRFHEARYRNVVTPAKMLILSDPTGDLKAAYDEGIAIRNTLDKRKDKIKADLKTTEIDLRFIKKNIRDYDAVHFAGHANYNIDDPSKSGWSVQDGIFSAEDIISLGSTAPLPSMVFSNACQSGQTEEWKIGTGFENEVYGLANAFLLAGVKHYIGTFWKVIDESCLLFAREFYKYVLEGLPIGESLKRARLGLIEQSGESSIIWSSYVLYGDPATSIFSPALKTGQILRYPDKKIFATIAISVAILVGVVLIATKFIISQPSLPFTRSTFKDNTVAVLPFENLSKDSSDIGSGISEVILAKLSSLKQIKVVDKTVVEKIWGSNKNANDLTEKKVFNLIGAKVVILGSYQKMDTKIRIIAKLIDASSGQVIDTTEVFGLYQDIFVLQDAIAFNILAKLNIKISPSEKSVISETQPTRNITAFEYFAQANESYIKADYQTAENLLKKAVELDPEYQQAIFGLGQVYEITNKWDLAKEYYEKFKAIVEKKSDKNAILTAYFNYGRFIGRTGDYKKAVEYEQKALEIAKEINSRQVYAAILSQLGIAYVGLSQDAKALETASEAKKIFEESNNLAALGDVYFNLALIHGFSTALDKEKAKEYFDKAISTYKSLNYNDGVFRAMFGIGTLPYFADKYPKDAIQYINKALNIAKDMNNSTNEGMCYKALADLYRNMADYGNAEQFYDKAILTSKDSNPRLHLDSVYNLAWLYLVQLNYEKAVDCLNQSSAEAEKIGDQDLSIKAKSEIASAYINMGRYGEAERILQELLKEKNKASDFTLQNLYLNAAKVNFKMGDLVKAEDMLKEAQPIFDKRPLEMQPYIFTSIASFYEEQGDYEKAIDYYNKAIKLYEQIGSPSINNLMKNGVVQTYYGIGKCYNAMKNYEKAGEFYNRALPVAIEINSPSLNSIKSDLYSLGAKQETDKFKIKNEDADVLYNKALRNIHEGKTNDAILLLSKANQIEPRNKEILKWLAVASEEAGKLDEAINYYLECVKLFDVSKEKDEIAGKYISIAFIYYSQNKLNNAVQYAEKALALAKETGNKRSLSLIYNDASRIYEALNEDDKALEFAQKGIALSEETKEIYVNGYHALALVYSKRKDTTKAIEYGELYLKKAQEAGMSNTGTMYCLLGSLYKDSDVIKATDYLNKAIDQFKRNSQYGDLGNAYYWLGDVYENHGQLDRALENYEKSLELSEKEKRAWTLESLYVALSRVYSYKNDLKKSGFYQNKYITLLKQAGENDKLGIYYSGIAFWSYKSNREKAKEYALKSIEEFGDTQDEKSLKILFGNYMMLGDLEENQDKAIVYLLKAIDLARRFNMSKEIEVLTHSIAIAYHKKKDFPTALEWYNKSLPLAKALNDKQVIDEASKEIDRLTTYLNSSKPNEEINVANNLSQKAYLYVMQGKYKIALENCNKALEIFRKNNNKEREAQTLGAIAAIYIGLDDFPNANKYIADSTKLYDDINNKKGVGIMHGAKGILLEKQSDYKNAEKEYNLAMSLLKGNEDEYKYQSAYYGCLGAICFKKGDYAKALEHYQKALDINEKKESQNIVCMTHLLFGHVYYKDKKYDNAIKEVTKSFDIAERIDDKVSMIIDSIIAGKASLALKMLEDAERYYKKAVNQAELLDDKKLKIISYANIAVYYSTINDMNNYNKYIALMRQNNGESYIINNNIDISKLDNVLDKTIEEKDYFTRLWL